MNPKSFLAIFAAALTPALPSAAVAQIDASPPTVVIASDSDQKVKCRKVEVTGSLVRKGKVCKTAAEWKRLQQLGNDAARAMAGEHICSGGECRGFEPPPNGN